MASAVAVQSGSLRLGGAHRGPASQRAGAALPRALRPSITPLHRQCRPARRRCGVQAGLEGPALPLPPALPPALPHSAAAEPRSPWGGLLRTATRAGGLVVLATAMALSTAGAAAAARSGGRMGGSSFGRSSFGGGMGGMSGAGGMGASAFSSGFGSRAGSFRSSYGAAPMGGGFGRAAPLAPSTGGVRVNSFFLSPFGYGYGMGYPMGGGGGGLLSLLFWGAFAVIMIQVVQGVMRSREGGGDTTYGGGYSEGYDEVLTVGKIQVGLLGSARELQQDLERIADRADTDSPAGLHYILQETVLALMRNPDYCLYGFAKSKRERSAEEAETAFNQLSLQERGKFQKETRINVAGMARRTSLKDSKPYKEGDQELIVVTLLVAADGGFKLPQVTSRGELKQALAMLGAVRADDLLAVEVLWTPEEEGDFFTTEDLAYDYPTLNTL
ncbi:hypothetical protein C2E20_4242 [Micractinium conductrix]|uniref:DUF1517 domain-containing protein n=1 Tax=Micractinium conductrix TaxID=554055 RepID=A0A2P6VEC4_9CHLO|nr:hypothetical protein C2E20_4242 [Micractinium conductrix]|eukprot:PSC72417.1 hypothetical protein C2E20_4242 [Micractinium conductrix]